MSENQQIPKKNAKKAAEQLELLVKLRPYTY